jgi:soluble lytic murein transglycosylase-like protein
MTEADGGSTSERTVGETFMTREELVAEARAAAVRHKLDAVLVCAVCEQESSWNPWAIRYEQAFRIRYVAPLGLQATEEIARSISWGLMQVMGEVARESGYSGPLPELCDPATGLELGCRVLAKKLAEAAGNPAKALQLWNGGGNPEYAAQVLARQNNYQIA